MSETLGFPRPRLGPNPVRALVRQLERSFNERIEELSQRVDRLEANQANFRHSVMADWTQLSNGKRIRVFNTKNSWSEADEVCRAHSGKLLHIDSEAENRRITDFLNGYDQTLYWIGAQTMVSFNLPRGRYHNFDGSTEEQGCAALSTAGKWHNRECNQLLSFICQF
ncbi:C-type lectin [Aphelenchoides avenae]|nr:C-type lectin [Aphelenchus avenae]